MNSFERTGWFHTALLALQEELQVLNVRRFSARMLHILEDNVLQILSHKCRPHAVVSPIHRLPHEILVAIFDNLRRAPEPTHRTIAAQDKTLVKFHLEFPSSPMDHRSLIAASQVCRQWRAAALHSPLLWTDIAASSPFALQSAERAQGLPVAVHADVLTGKLTKMQKKAIWRLRTRIRTLVLRIESPAQLVIFTRTLRALAPSLESLALVISGSNGVRSYAITMLGNGRDFFGGQARALKSLLIVSHAPIVPTDRCPNLLTFRLHITGRTGMIVSHSMHLQPLSRFLAHAPALTLLNIHNSVWPAATQGEAGIVSPALLSRLRQLSLAGAAIQGWSEVAPTVPRMISSLACTPHPKALLKNMMVDTDEEGLVWYICGQSGSALRLWVNFAVDRFMRYHPPSFAEQRSPLPILSMSESAKLIRITGTSIQRLARHTQKGSKPTPILSEINESMVDLETLVCRVAADDFMLPQLRDRLVQSRPVACPNLKTLVFSVLNPACALEDFHQLFEITAERAALGYPLKQLIVCSPAHTRPDYSMYNVHGVEWVTFSRSDAGASAHSNKARFALRSQGEHGLHGTLGTSRREGCACARGDTEPPFCSQYDRAWWARIGG